ncbi:hypothetical protein O9992_24210 [Vibrio lentus]|nr:hypothetical protein [Vibrio lentus]
MPTQDRLQPSGSYSTVTEFDAFITSPFAIKANSSVPFLASAGTVQKAIAREKATLNLQEYHSANQDSNTLYVLMVIVVTESLRHHHKDSSESYEQHD